MLPAALHTALIEACHAAGPPRLGFVFGSVARGTARPGPTATSTSRSTCVAPACR